MKSRRSEGFQSAYQALLSKKIHTEIISTNKNIPSTMNPQDFFTSSLKYPHFFWGAFLGGPRWFHSHDSNLLQSGDRCKWHVWIWPHSWDINIAMTLVDVQHHPEMGVSSNGGTPKWMVYNWKPYSNGWFGGTTIFGNIQICRWFCLMCFVRYARCPKKPPTKNSEMQFVDWRES